MSFWNDERADRARTLWLSGQSADRIASTFGYAVTRNAVMGKLQRMGLVGGRQGGKSPKPWTAEQDARLVELRKDSRTAPEIAQSLGRSQYAIQSRLRQLGVASPPPGPKPAAPRRATPRQAAAPAAPKRKTPPGLARWADQPKSAAARRTHAERLAEAAIVAETIRCEAASTPADGIALIDHTDAMCRWVVGDPLKLHYCGSPRVGRGSYCQKHDLSSINVAARRAREIEHV